MPYRECPHFKHCGVNACPLRPDYLKLSTCKDDPETKCNALRSTRERIASKYPGVLPTFGVLKAESYRDAQSLKAKARWNALSPEQKAERVAKLTPFKKKVI